VTKRLLDRQSSLLKYLTSGAAIFGDSEDASLDRNLQGIDGRLLHLEARFSYQKRMEKIVAVFPRTFEILGRRRAAIVQKFAETCPPTDISRLVNAGQFRDFLCTHRWGGSKDLYLRDVASCELACAKVRATVEQQEAHAQTGKRRSGHFIRRNPAIALLRCAYDIRSIFERDGGWTPPKKRDTPLVIAIPPEADDARIFEIAPVAFDLLVVLDDWTDRNAFGETPEIRAFLAELLEHAFIEVAE
jgi:hypothetical protein